MLTSPHNDNIKYSNDMRKIIMMILVAMATMSVSAQKFALVDMEFILKNVPAYERANEQLNQVSKKWQAEVEAQY